VHKLLNRILGKDSDSYESPNSKEKESSPNFTEEQQEILTRTLKLQEEKVILTSETLVSISESLTNSEKREKFKFYLDLVLFVLFLVFLIYMVISIQRS